VGAFRGQRYALAFLMVTNRTMYDSDNLATVPKTGATMIAYYLDINNSEEVSNLFPKWSQIPIDRHGTNPHLARVFDVETGAINPDDNLADLITEFNETSVFFKTGGRPVIYCDRSNIATVRKNTGKYILGKDYYLWVSAPDGPLYTGTGVVACQNIFGNGYDSSVVFSSQWVPNG
jgi:hypothetical protein